MGGNDIDGSSRRSGRVGTGSSSSSSFAQAGTGSDERIRDGGFANGGGGGGGGGSSRGSISDLHVDVHSADRKSSMVSVPQGYYPVLLPKGYVFAPNTDAAHERKEEQWKPSPSTSGHSQGGLAYTVENTTGRRMKPVAFSAEELWGLSSQKILALGMFPFMLQRKKVVST